ncbi:QWRF motif-containing protein 2-like isoform X2 [Durio zibethinus]|uniref:QWRF motif-containing protein 2-like isoform X2 n=1 Tax=Durio zibethinus TaxID=66656 RepID=A0A6P5ZJ54_DURZI|nr:QWRF motif-containing protein 2-like isoform X2 [Durio zibethinus]
MVAEESATANPKQHGGGPPHQNPSRPPLLPSDPDNAIAPRRRKFREVTSRYLSPSLPSSNSSMPLSSSSAASSKWCPSPLVSRTSHSTAVSTPTHAIPSAIKRSPSVERIQAATPGPNNSIDLKTSNGNNNNGELSAAQKLLFTSTRSLSVSFQGESFAHQFSKAKPAPSPSATRKGTPERRRPTAATTTPGRGTDQIENSKTERLPVRLRQPNSVSRSMDCTDERKRLNGSVNGNVVRALQNSMIDNRDLTAVTAVGFEAHCDLAASDTESVSSSSTSGALESSCNGNGDVKRGPRRIMVPARFWQETNNRLRRSDPGSPVSKKNTAQSKLIAPDKFGIDSPLSSPKGVGNSRGQLSPIREPVRPASPSKVGASSTSSPLRGVSPTRVRNGLGGNLVNTPSILSFSGDVIKMGKIGENKVYDAHLLRLLHNKLLQWRFVNARADAALSSQKSNAEKSLYDAWITTSKLRESVRAKRTELQLLRQNLKLSSILKGQMELLDEWAVLDHDYCSSLSGASEALMASTLRLPVVSGARVNSFFQPFPFSFKMWHLSCQCSSLLASHKKHLARLVILQADVPKLKDAICSAVDVMQAITFSICPLLSKVATVSSLVAELGNLSVNEFALLDQCEELLPTIAAMQVKECSLRTHILQLDR